MNGGNAGLGDFVYPFAVTAQPNERFAAIPFDFQFKIGTQGQQQVQRYTMSYGYDFVMSMINGFSDDAVNGMNAVSINITDTYRSEDLFFGPLIGSEIVGNGQNSFLLPKLHKFMRGRTIEITLVNRTNNQAALNVEIVLIGYKIVDYSPEMELTSQDINMPASVAGWEGYKGAASVGGYGKTRPARIGNYGQVQNPAGSTNAPNVVPIKAPGIQFIVDRFFATVFDFAMAGGTYISTFPVSTGFDFMWEIVNAFSAREFLLQIKDEFVTEDFFTSPMHSSIICGTGVQPFILPRPYIFRGGTNISVTITDTNSVGTSTPVELALIGYKVRRIS
jgi:hypothetical protein